MKKICLLISAVFLFTFLQAQNSGQKHAISLGLDHALGRFDSTHGFGIGADYAWSNERFGRMSEKPSKLIGFTFNVGIDHYIGKKIHSGTYKYDNYTYIHAYGGILHNPCLNGNINLTAGPFLSLWDGGSEFGFGVNLGGSIGISDNIAISPGIFLMKYSASKPITSATLRASLAF